MVGERKGRKAAALPLCCGGDMRDGHSSVPSMMYAHARAQSGAQRPTSNEPKPGRQVARARHLQRPRIDIASPTRQTHPCTCRSDTARRVSLLVCPRQNPPGPTGQPPADSFESRQASTRPTRGSALSCAQGRRSSLRSPLPMPVSSSVCGSKTVNLQA